MERCQTCGQEIKTAEAAASKQAKSYVNIASAEAFNELCHTLRRHPDCTDSRFKGALEDFPKALKHFKQLTEGQWKFFSVIHNKLLGIWPPHPSEIVDKPRHTEMAGDIDNCPF